VWSGTRAAARGLVDVVGGLWEAVALAKQAAGIPAEEKVTVTEVTRAATSPLALLAGGGAAAGAASAALAALARGGAPSAALATGVGAAALQQLLAGAASAPGGVGPASLLALLQGLQQGQVLAFDFDAASAASGAPAGGLAAAAGIGSGGASLFDEAEGPWGAVAEADAAVSAALEEWLL
jgi:hypothetical protein